MASRGRVALIALGVGGRGPRPVRGHRLADRWPVSDGGLPGGAQGGRRGGRGHHRRRGDRGLDTDVDRPHARRVPRRPRGARGGAPDQQPGRRGRADPGDLHRGRAAARGQASRWWPRWARWPPPAATTSRWPPTGSTPTPARSPAPSASSCSSPTSRACSRRSASSTWWSRRAPTRTSATSRGP